MKCKKPETDQSVEFAIFASGVKCTEYVAVAPCFSDDPDVVECVVPVSPNDTITIEGTFTGTVLNASFDVLADGSFIADRRLEGSNFDNAKKAKRPIKFRAFFDVSANQQQVIEGDLSVRKLTIASAGYMNGSKLGVGVIAIIVSATQKIDDHYIADYPDCKLQQWKERGDTHEVANGGVQPKFELELTKVDHGVHPERQSRHQRHFTQTRFGMKPFAKFIFYYRGKDSITGSRCRQVPSDACHSLSPPEGDEFVAAAPSSRQQHEDEDEESPYQSTLTENTGSGPAIRPPERDAPRRRGSMFASPSLEHREGPSRSRTSTGPTIRLSGRKRKGVDRLHMADTDTFGNIDEYEPDSLFLPPHSESEEDSVFDPHDEHRKSALKLSTRAQKSPHKSAPKPVLKRVSFESSAQAKDDLHRVRRSFQSPSRVEKQRSKKTIELAAERSRFGDLKIPVVDSLGTKLLRTTTPTLQEIRDVFPPGNGLNVEELYHLLKYTNLPIDKIFEMVDMVAIQVGKKYYVKNHKGIQPSKQVVVKEKQGEEQKQRQEKEEEEKAKQQQAEEKSESDSGEEIIVKESNFSRNTNAAVRLINQSLPRRHQKARESLVDYVARMEQIVSILHSRLDKEYKEHNITDEEIQKYEEMKKRRDKVEKARQRHLEAQMFAGVQAQVRARVDAEVELQLTLMRLSKPQLESRMAKAKREEAILEHIRDEFRKQAEEVQGKEQAVSEKPQQVVGEEVGERADEQIGDQPEHQHHEKCGTEGERQVDTQGHHKIDGSHDVTMGEQNDEEHGAEGRERTDT